MLIAALSNLLDHFSLDLLLRLLALCLFSFVLDPCQVFDPILVMLDVLTVVLVAHNDTRFETFDHFPLSCQVLVAIHLVFLFSGCKTCSTLVEEALNRVIKRLCWALLSIIALLAAFHLTGSFALEHFNQGLPLHLYGIVRDLVFPIIDRLDIPSDVCLNTLRPQTMAICIKPAIIGALRPEVFIGHVLSCAIKEGLLVLFLLFHFLDQVSAVLLNVCVVSTQFLVVNQILVA